MISRVVVGIELGISSIVGEGVCEVGGVCEEDEGEEEQDAVRIVHMEESL